MGWQEKQRKVAGRQKSAGDKGWVQAARKRERRKQAEQRMTRSKRLGRAMGEKGTRSARAG
ncbi:hypothetical protein D5273_04010 [Enterorhabdus caecimuris]|nr:hypothetical protein [Adlercreutzia caecimuris]